MKKLILIIILGLISSATSIAQPDDSSSDRKTPTFYGHTFPSMGNFASSFINTSLQANLGFGSTSTIKVPGISIGDNEILTFQGKIMFFNMDVKYQQRFNPWLALFISFSMGGRVGTDMSTILVDGVNTLSGGSIGWRIRIREAQRFNLSSIIRVINLSGNFINVADYFRDVINNVPNPSVTRKIPSTTIGTGLMGAYAFNPTFGIQFNGEYAFGESFEREKNQSYLSAGIMGDVDFLPAHNVPVGIAFGYALSSAPSIVMSDGGVSNLFSGKVGYTGSDDFELGLQFTYYNVNIKSVDNKPYLSKIILSLKFYF